MPERIIILLLTITLVIALVSCTDGELTTPQEFLERAQKLTVDNRPIAAILEAKNALQRDGTLLTGRWVLAQNYLKLREGMLAEIELEKLRERGFTHTDFDASYYHALLLQGHYIEIADQAAKLNPTAIDLTFRGEANLGLSDLETDPELRKNREGYVGIAEQYFQRAIKLEPSYVRAHLELVRVAIWQREYETAAQSLNVAERLDANDISVWNLRGVLNQVTEQFDDAERTYRKAVGLAPYDLLVQINLARILLIQKKGGESAELLDKLIRAHPRMPTLPYLRAVAFLQEGDRESAADQLSGVVAKYPAYLEAAVLLAQILVDLDRLGQAESALFAALENFPADTRAQQLLSRLRAKQASRNTDNESPSTHTTDLIGKAYLSSADGREQRRQRDVARDRKREYIEFTAKSPLEQLDTIDTLLRERNFEKVLKIANLIQSNSPDQPLPYYFMGRAFVAQGDALNARTTFSLALKNDPDYFPAIVNLATIEIDQGNLERAEELFKQAVAIDADSSPAKLGLVRVELARGNYDAADSQIDDVLSRNPNDIAALLAAAEMAHQQEDVARKLGFLKQIVQIAPTSMQARTLMAQTYLEQNEYQHARHVIGEAIDIEPNHPGALLMLSEVQFRNDERQASLITAERLAVRFPKQSDVQRALAIAQIRNDDRAAASDTLKHSLSVNGGRRPNAADAHNA